MFNQTVNGPHCLSYYGCQWLRQLSGYQNTSKHPLFNHTGLEQHKGE